MPPPQRLKISIDLGHEERPTRAGIPVAAVAGIVKSVIRRQPDNKSVGTSRPTSQAGQVAVGKNSSASTNAVSAAAPTGSVGCIGTTVTRGCAAMTVSISGCSAPAR